MKESPRAASRHRGEVLAQLRPYRTHSRSELARRTGLSAATVSRITRELVRGKVLTETVRPRSSAGRPERGLELNGRSGAVLGISLLVPELRGLVLNLRGDVLKELREPLRGDRGPEGILGPLRKLVQGRIPRLLGVGVALPGQWEPETGVSVTYPRVPDWKDVPLRRRLEQWTRVPATLVGYAPALAVAEQARRAGREPANLISVEVGDYIAMGAIAHGAVLEGVSGNAGELGHIPVDPGGPVCYCGGTGCLESAATCLAVVEEVRESEAARGVFPDPGRVVFEDVVRHAREGHPYSARLLAKTARSLGIGLATALSLFNPEVLVLNGRFFDAGDLVLEPVRAAIRDHAIPSSQKKLSIERSELGPLAPALGAGIAAIRAALLQL
jgi:predicted NBD/HSP70 family sugar kinase